MLLDEVPDSGGGDNAHPRLPSGSSRLPRRVPSLSPGETARSSLPSIDRLSAASVRSSRRLLTRLAVAFAGVISPSLSESLCRESVRTGNPLILTAMRGEAVFGMAIAVTDHGRFWRRFFLRHPLHALGVIWQRAGFVPEPEDDAVGGGHHPVATPSWSDAGPDIAKVLFIGVAPEDRREGCGQRLYAELFRRLRDKGAKRIDARIDIDNHASIRLHEATGWSVWRDGTSAFATRRLV